MTTEAQQDASASESSSAEAVGNTDSQQQMSVNPSESSFEGGDEGTGTEANQGSDTNITGQNEQGKGSDNVSREGRLRQELGETRKSLAGLSVAMAKSQNPVQELSSFLKENPNMAKYFEKKLNVTADKLEGVKSFSQVEDSEQLLAALGIAEGSESSEQDMRLQGVDLVTKIDSEIITAQVKIGSEEIGTQKNLTPPEVNRLKKFTETLLKADHTLEVEEALKLAEARYFGTKPVAPKVPTRQGGAGGNASAKANDPFPGKSDDELDADQFAERHNLN